MRVKLAVAFAIVLAGAGSIGGGVRAQTRYGAGVLPPDPSRMVYRISPRDADPAVSRFLDDNVVIFRNGTPAAAPLLVFMPGTNGRPQGLLRFLDTASRAGYRVIGLTYNDSPAVNVVCPRDPDEQCNEHFREKRIYGNDVTKIIDDSQSESIVNRLTKLLQYLAAKHPGENWQQFLSDDRLNWSRIAFGGHSQGAGMAAFIAKDHAVDRVVLFSSPWDFHAPNQRLATWLSKPPATPIDRWYAAYHQREPTAMLIQRAYAALGIPASHVEAFDAEPNRSRLAPNAGSMIYHTSVVGDLTTPLAEDGTPAYLQAWLRMLGTP